MGPPTELRTQRTQRWSEGGNCGSSFVPEECEVPLGHPNRDVYVEMGLELTEDQVTRQCESLIHEYLATENYSYHDSSRTIEALFIFLI